MTDPKEEPNLAGALSDEPLTGVTEGTADPDIIPLPSPMTQAPVPTPYPIPESEYLKKVTKT